MLLRSIAGLLIVLIGCFGIERTSIGDKENENGSDLRLVHTNGPLIENKINRGINYMDPQGNDFNIRYIPISITNDSTISMHVQLAFSKEYHFPHPLSEEKFKLMPLPREWALDGIGISERWIDALPTQIENPVLTDTIEPGEKIIFAIASLYPRPAKTTGVLPSILFAQSDRVLFPDCDGYAENMSSNQGIPMGLRITFGAKCRIIPCGHVSYPEL